MKEIFTVNEDGEILCPCRNEPSWAGFTPCHRDGTGDDTLLVAGDDRPVFYRCDQCGRIAEEKTLEVVGIA